MAKFLDLSGRTFGRLTVGKFVGSDKHGFKLWSCVCSCGGEKTTTTQQLRKGGTQSCGCLLAEARRKEKPSLRTVQRTGVKCSSCGGPVTRFSEADKTLTNRRVRKALCPDCLKESNRKSGRTNSEKNNRIVMTTSAEQVILGSILGDGHISKNRRNASGNFYLTINHGLKQEQYAKWKLQLIGELGSSKVSKSVERRNVTVRSKTSSAITKVWESFHENGTFKVTTASLSKFDVLALAIWYMDDGTLACSRSYESKSGKIINYKPEIRLCTHSFAETDVLTMIEMLKTKFDIVATKYKFYAYQNFDGTPFDERREYPGIRIFGQEAFKLIDLINTCPNIRESGMDYKLQIH